MALATTHTGRPGLGTTDRLAAARPAVFRAGVTKSVAIDAAGKLRRAKERLYVLCQLVGWGGFTGVQVFFYSASGPEGHGSNRQPLIDISVLFMVMLMGLLLTHYARMVVHRRGWKELGWAALLPRAIGASVGMSVIWSAVGFGYFYLLLGYPWTSKFSPLFAIAISTINGVIMFIGWFCVYFIYHAFERMQRMQVEQLRLVAAAKDAELRALKSQINPHFLFNSLNSLRALIDEDAPRARESVTRMANMLRYSLQSGQLETVALEDELRIVEDYLALEQIRHEERLQVRWEIDENVRNSALLVPPMLIQTLVENAVKYGIGSRREGGEIVIAARIEGWALSLQVTNPGELTALNGHAESTGVGLRNASERLQLLFGHRATLQLRAEPAGCVTAHVRIPLQEEAR